VVREDSPQTHGPGMNDGLNAHVAETGMAVHDFNLLPDDDVAEDGEEGKHGGEGRLPIDDEEGHMIDFDAIGQVPYSVPAFVCMGDDDDFMASVDEFLLRIRWEPNDGRESYDQPLTAGRCDFQLRLHCSAYVINNGRRETYLVAGRRSHRPCWLCISDDLPGSEFQD
jgi:hypothetical protein